MKSKPTPLIFDCFRTGQWLPIPTLLCTHWIDGNFLSLIIYLNEKQATPIKPSFKRSNYSSYENQLFAFPENLCCFWSTYNTSSTTIMALFVRLILEQNRINKSTNYIDMNDRCQPHGSNECFTYIWHYLCIVDQLDQII